MADTPEAQYGPPAVDQTGNLTIWAIPGATVGINPDSITKAQLDAATAKRVTYSFIPGGWNYTMPQDKLDDPRLTALQVKQSLGQIKPAFDDLKYVDSTDAGSAAVILVPGSWIFVERRNVPNATTAATPQIVRGIKLTLGPQVPGPLDGNGKFSITQAAVVDYISEPHALSAGS